MAERKRTDPYRTKLGLLFSEGARLAWRELERRGWTQAQLLAELGEKPGALTRILYGERLPNRRLALRFHDVLNIPIESWDAKPRRPFTPPAARAA